MRSLVILLHYVMPSFLFKRIRRNVALCAYNFHSARRSTSDRRGLLTGGSIETCKHCGSFVYRDREGEWRQHFSALSVK